MGWERNYEGASAAARADALAAAAANGAAARRLAVVLKRDANGDATHVNQRANAALEQIEVVRAPGCRRGWRSCDGLHESFLRA